MAQMANTEMIPKLKACIEGIEDLQRNLKAGIANTMDICQESGSQKLISSCQAASDGSDTIVAVAGELVETLEMLKKQYEKLEAAL